MAKLLTRDPFDSPSTPASERKSREDARKVRVNFDIDADLHRRLKVAAAEQGRTIADVARELLAGWLYSDTPLSK